jgi:hypothetical protein
MIGVMLTITSIMCEAQSVEPRVLSGKTGIGKLLLLNPVCPIDPPDRMAIVDYRVLHGGISCYYHQTKMRKLWNKIITPFRRRHSR